MRYLTSILASLSLLFGTTSCCGWPYCWYGVGEWVQKIDASEITYAVQHYMAYLRHVHRLRLEEAAVYYHDTIHTLRMEFISMDVWEVCDARELLVDVVEGLLHELNNNPVLAPQYLHYPLTADDLEIYIRFESFEMVYVDPYYVTFMSLEHGMVTFYDGNVNDPKQDLWEYRVEPYYKSREFVLYGREAEAMFKQAFDMDYPNCLIKEQYCPKERPKPRYYTDYCNQYSYDHP